MYTNADGLVNKRQELKALINSVKDYPHVIAVTEIKPTRIWHEPAKHANRMDARAHSSTLAECAPKKL